MTWLAMVFELSHSLCQPTGEWGCIPEQLSEVSRVSQSGFWPSGGWGWDLGGPSANSVSLVGGAVSQRL